MAAKLIKSILTIAGSDPSGGAGIQADLKTFNRLKVYGSAAITCLTIQNTKGVTASYPVASDIVAGQIGAVLDDLQISHIKIGMIGTAEIAKAVSKTLAGFQGEIIYDPVLVSSSGLPLLDDEGLATVIQELIGLATVLTPNLDELARISGRECGTTTAALDAAGSLLLHFPKMRALILKGGHLRDDKSRVNNYLLLAKDKPNVHYRATHPRIHTSNSHGTGCTFAAAFAAYHMHDADYEQAFRQSSAFVWRLLKEGAAFRTGQGNGGLLHYL